MKFNKIYITPILLVLAVFVSNGQEAKVITLEDASKLALENSRLLKIKNYQVAEKQTKISENRVKYFPVATVNSGYTYNTEVSELSIPAGKFGSLPIGGNTISLPGKETVFPMTEKNLFNAGIQLYQPITQMGKISQGVSVSKYEAKIVEKEADKARMQIKQAIEKLYYGILISEQQKLESESKIAMLELKTSNIESAVASGKALESNQLGILATLADEQQTLLKTEIQLENYKSDFKQLTGIEEDNFTLAMVEFKISELGSEKIDSTTVKENADIQIANFTQSKAKAGLSAAKYSYLPDFGVVGGYDYQSGNYLYPINHLYIGVALKWNLNDFAGNTYSAKQRKIAHLQATENRLNVEETTLKEANKIERNIRQALQLINVAQKVVDYRTKDFEIQQSKLNAGLILESDFLGAKASLAKSQSDLLAAQLSYRIAVSEKQILEGSY